MVYIEISAEDLYMARKEQITGLLRPLRVGTPTRLTVYSITEGNIYAISMHEGVRTDDNYRRLRFATFRPEYRANYFEQWVPSDPRQRNWHLKHACLSIYHSNPMQRWQAQTDETEVFGLHCEPNEPKTAAHAAYKRGPHLHISIVPGHPISHAHIALAKSHLSAILKNAQTLSAEVRQAIQMIQEEVLVNMP
jgi:hypothetical protein